MIKIGKIHFFSSLMCLLKTTSFVYAASLTVEPSSTTIGLEENLALEFRVQTEKISSEIGEPQYTAPDFNEVNVYKMTGQQVESRLEQDENGNYRNTTKVVRTQAVVLAPKKIGKFKISNLKVEVDNKIVTADPIEIEVVDAGRNSRAAQGWIGGGGNVGVLPQSGANAAKGSIKKNLVLKTEPDKLKVYKGQQILLTYALYTRTQIENIQVERYPTVPGFIKEEIDIPLLRNQLKFSRAVLNGQEFKRAVLAQYAIFPVKEGKLEIDPFTGKFRIRGSANSQFLLGDDDVMSLFNQFFQGYQSEAFTQASDRVEIQVLPLPAQGRPESFNGLVGDFSISSQVDKNLLKAGESLNLKIKVEGKGHVGNLDQLKIKWPEEFEMYEDKAQTNFQKTGYSERTFDFMLVAKKQGTWTLPAVEISFFDPETASYKIQKTQPITITVNEGKEFSNTNSTSLRQMQEPRKNSVSGLAISQEVFATIINFLKVLIILAVIILVGIGFYLFLKKRKNRKLSKREILKQIQSKMSQLTINTKNKDQLLFEAESFFAQILDNGLGVLKGSLKANELKEVVFQRTNNAELSELCKKWMEDVEFYRFAPIDGDLKNKIDELLSELNKILKLVDQFSRS